MLRTTNKYVKYSGLKQTEIELIIHFCKTFRNTGFPIHKSTAANNIYLRQIAKIDAITKLLHEDLQHDYKKEIATLI